jgi:hypothetical protein
LNYQDFRGAIKEEKLMTGYIIISIISGILFGILDGVINANPLARRLYKVYEPIAKTSLNPIAGIVIDLVFGFVMAGFFYYSTIACQVRAGS